MKLSKLVKTTLAGAVVVSAMGLVAPANAACIKSQWAKVSGNSYASKIYGRLCGSNMSVRFTGAVNTGWIAMHGGSNQFNATFVDANVTTKISMQTNGNTMHANFIHTDNGGATSLRA